MTTVNNNNGGAGPGAEGVLHERINTLQSDHVELKASIDRQFTSVHSAIQSIANEIKDRAKFNWQPVGILLTFVTVVGGLVYYPIKEGMASQSDTMKIIAEKMVTEKELSTFVGATRERRDDQQRVAEARFTRVEGEVDKLQGAVVPRGELEANWSSQRARDTEFQRQLDEQRGRVESIYSPRDAIASLQRTVEDLQARLSGGKR